MSRTVNLIMGLTAASFGIWIFVNLTPLLLHPTAMQAVLVDLPTKYHGLSPALKIALFTFTLILGAVALFWAMLCLIRSSSLRVSRLNIIFAVQLTISLVVFEAFARVGNTLNISVFSKLTYFVNPACGEMYYRLARPIGDAVATKAYDPILGWKPKSRPGNLQGLPWPTFTDERPKAWFFGDSFTAGVVMPEDSIPARFEKYRPKRQALNFGVGGYGVDQIWLRYEQESDKIPEGSPIYIGILTTDLDRSVLGYFFGYKPVFRPEGTEFKYIAPPPREDIAEFARQKPETIPSYSLALLRTAAELVTTQFDRSETHCGLQEKQAVNAYLMDRLLNRAKERKHQLRWIIFVSFASFYKPMNWRHDFLTGFLTKRRQFFLDSREALSREARLLNVAPEIYYIPNDGHLNAKGNDIIAKYLSRLEATNNNMGSQKH